MKRIIYLLVTLFTILGHQSNAQQINVDIGAVSGQIGDIVSIPVVVQLPQGSQTLYSCQGTISSSNPSIAEIVGFSDPAMNQLSANIVNSGEINFIIGLAGNPISFPNNVMMIIDVEILAAGCSDFNLNGSVTNPGTLALEFIVDGVVYNDLASDFNVNQGQVCGDCPLHITKFGVYPDNQSTTLHYVNQTGNEQTNYADYTSNCIPYTVAPHLVFNASQGNVYMAIYLDNDNNGTYEITIISGFNSGGLLNSIVPSGSINPNAGIRIIVSDQPITDPTTIPVCGEVEDYVFCEDCACDLGNSTLGPISYWQDPNDCLAYSISVPAITSCSDSAMYETYSFSVFDSNGILVYWNSSNTNATIVTFPANGTYSIEVTYTVLDNTGCTHVLTHQENFTVSGCCACDFSDLTLGPITLSQTGANCSCFEISVPPVVGCSSVVTSQNYKFKVYSTNNNSYEEIDSSNPNITYCFDAPGSYTITVRYTMIDQTGCEHNIQLSRPFNYAGCGCQLLNPPTNLLCSEKGTKNGSQQTLSWSPVLGADSYEIEYTYNDPDCCPVVSDPGTFPSLDAVIGTSTKIISNTCFSWRVRAVCENGTKSAWSSKACSCGLTGVVIGGLSKLLTESDDQGDEGQLHLTAVPNPALNHVDITVSALLVDDLMLSEPVMTICDMIGKVVYRSDVKLNETQRVDISSFNSGIYIVKISDGNTTVTQKIVKK